MAPQTNEVPAKPRGFAALASLLLVQLSCGAGCYVFLALLAVRATSLAGDAAAQLVALVTSAIAIAAVAGSLVADRVLGPRRALAVGSCVGVAGYVAFAALPADIGIAASASLLCLAAGLGGHCTASLTASLFSSDDPRRDGAFSLLFAARTVGGLVPVALSGLVATGSAVAAWAAVLMAALGCVAWLVWGRGAIPSDVPMTTSSPPRRLALLVPPVLIAVACGAVAHLGTNGSLALASLAQGATVLSAVLAVAGAGYLLERSPKALRWLPTFGCGIVSGLVWGQLSVLLVALVASADPTAGLTAHLVDILPASLSVSLGILCGLAWLRRGQLSGRHDRRAAAGVLLGGASLLLLAIAVVLSNAAPAFLVPAVAVCCAVAMAGEVLGGAGGASSTAAVAPRGDETAAQAIWSLSRAVGLVLSSALLPLLTNGTELSYLVVTALVVLALGCGALFVSRR